MKKPSRAVWITLNFVLAGMLWILCSDYVLNYFAPRLSGITVAHLQLLKGLLFIGLSGAVIFVLLHDSGTRSERTFTEQDTLFRCNPVPMCLVASESFRLLEVNEAAQRIWGYSDREFAFFSLGDLVDPDDRQRFQEVQLFMRTGFDKLGVCKFRSKDGNVYSFWISATMIRSKHAFLISFRDVTEEIRVQSELSHLSKTFQQQIVRRTDYLERTNEELAYRASQTEHVNAELIVVNEQLLKINKKIAAENASLSAERDGLLQILMALKECVWSYNLSHGGKCYPGQGIQELFDVTGDELHRPWFWLDYIHPDDAGVKELHQRTVFERGETFSSFRIVTGKGAVRRLLNHTRITRAEPGGTFLVSSFSDVTNYPTGDLYHFNVRTA